MLDSPNHVLDAKRSATADFRRGAEEKLSGDYDDAVYYLKHLDSEERVVPCEVKYCILSEADIEQRQAALVERVSTFLSISEFEAFVLLLENLWSATKVYDEWFCDEDHVRKVHGLLKDRVEMPNEAEIECQICFETHPRDSARAAACGHPFCVECWKAYIGTAINQSDLVLKCPSPNCGAVVGNDMINLLMDAVFIEKYRRFLHGSYIQHNPKRKWCPSPGCEYAVEYFTGSGSYAKCACSYEFCWNCTKEAHSPVDCDTVSKWLDKNSVDSMNVDWLLKYAKPCPSCKTPIEKNQGCMHIKCTAPCNFHFCWLCLHPWEGHTDFYACNRYEKEKEAKDFQSQMERQMAKNSSEKYAHYYERWGANHKSRDEALAELQNLKNGKLEKLSNMQNQPEAQLTFMKLAWLQVIECRRVLKWTYVHGFYFPESEVSELERFEYLQGVAESCLEQLHHCVEQELEIYLTAERSEDFNIFRQKLTNLTRVTGDYFKNLVTEMETASSKRVR